MKGPSLPAIKPPAMERVRLASLQTSVFRDSSPARHFSSSSASPLPPANLLAEHGPAWKSHCTQTLSTVTARYQNTGQKNILDAGTRPTETHPHPYKKRNIL